ncbi:autotransporter domain-containing protein [Sphingomonas japonica]|uniref:Autotransporter domain-containing protein n=1 Tax=Sphingomonas japonica TaxID=511662 RepID=A0ABX0TVY7_9SPHN|nr:autotransporter outer membrane beta-barrel domain-containing protein [Sphingomonas japonica]NIJ22475.1 hypothetical protein [Sphingomonas japonica]
MRILLATTSLTPILLALVPQAQAQTSISTATTTPVRTSTAGNVTVTAAGSIKPTTSGAIITLDSTNNVTNQGTIQKTGVNDSDGILVTDQGSGAIVNSGNIILDEAYTPEDTDDDGDIDGPFARGARRVGIRTTGAFAGSISNSGDITIEGNDSAGIRVGGALTGNLSNSGDIAVIGDDAVGIDVRDVTGNLRLDGTVGVQGADAVGVRIDGDVTGRVTVQGSIASTGYRATTAPSDPSDLDADDLLQGGSALVVAGNVGGGVLLDAPPANTDPDEADEDDDGTPDANEGTASVRTFGSSPAISIGSDDSITLGGVAGDAGGHGLVVRGGVAASGVYAGVDATGIRIGGQGGAVDLNGGVRIDGTLSATSRADATALLLGSGTSADAITIGGTVTAGGGNAADAQARAIVIAAGASAPVLRNTGGIGAAASGDGTAIAILDQSGTLDLIENAGAIEADGGNDGGGSIAIDLTANDGGAIVRQLLAEEDETAPGIVGDIRFGDGGDLLDIADGGVSGDVSFAGGDNSLRLSGDARQAGDVSFGGGADTVALTGTASLNGAIDFGGGDDLMTLGAGTIFRGTLANSGGLALSVGDGTFDYTGSGTVALTSLAVEGGAIAVNIGEAGATRYVVAGAASFGEGATVRVGVSEIAGSLGDYVIVDAGALTGADNLGSVAETLPYLFKSSLASDVEAGTVTLSIARKTTTELGLNRSQSAAYDAIFDILDTDAGIRTTFLGIGDGETFQRRIASFLPDHAGGTFESVTMASRAAARILNDPAARFLQRDRWSLWLQQVAWGTSKDLGDTAAYDIGGWGINGGGEVALGGAGRVGLSLAYLQGTDADGFTDNEVLTGQYELAAHWRGNWSGFAASARGGVSKIDFSSQRRFDSTDADNSFARVSEGSWGGMLYSAQGAMSYELAVGRRLKLRPQAAIDYYRLSEDAHTEAGGGEAFDLTVAERTSDELAATGSLSLGYELGSLDPQASFLRLEVEGGRREIVGGALGTTTAQFGDGDPFTLLPEDRDSGFIGRVRLSGGQSSFIVTGEASAEERLGHAAIAARLGLQARW